MRLSRLGLLFAVAMVPLVLWASLPVLSDGAPRSRAARWARRSTRSAGRSSRRRAASACSRPPSSATAARSGRCSPTSPCCSASRSAIQADLDAKRAELARIQEELRQERIRLARLKARLAEARVALAGRLIELYKADKPDVVTVVLNADGFADLLDRTEFMQRVSDQDARIIDRVRTARAEATRTANHLDKLEKRQTKVAAAIEARRDEVATVRGQLVDRRDQFAAVRSDKASALASTRESRKHLEGDLRALEAANARVQSQLAAAPNGSAPSTAGPIRPGSGGLVWPVNGPIVSPFGMRWGRLHAGVDIAVPAGTPIRAAQSGKVILMGWTGGYGNYTCIGHGNGLSTCYAHQSSYATSNGASVSKGQVIGSVGCTGHCFGDHLHFETRVGGAPVNPAGYL